MLRSADLVSASCSHWLFQAGLVSASEIETFNITSVQGSKNGMQTQSDKLWAVNTVL